MKTRHQLYLPDDLSRRLSALSRSGGRARSEILVEALEAWFSRRSAPPNEEAIRIRLDRIERAIAGSGRTQQMLWEGMSRLIRHQLITAAGLPPPDATAQARGAAQYQRFLDDVATMIATDRPAAAP
ncbi:MAG: hypothetical protein JOY99_10225 [Sphingomonadaceae bacterium]|nr:hypothetical protein [Sphingomonadaceae bacterium]